MRPVLLALPLVAAMASAEDQALRGLLDRQQITEVLHRYGQTFDAKDADGFASLFTEDAHWKIHRRGTERPQFENTSRSELKDFVADRFSTVLAGRHTHHYVTGTVFLELTEDFARTRSTVLVVHRILETAALVPVNAPVYMDEFVKTEAGWKISRHTAN